MSSNRSVNIITLYGAKMFSKSVRKTSANFIDVELKAFTTRDAVEDVSGSACKVLSK